MSSSEKIVLLDVIHRRGSAASSLVQRSRSTDGGRVASPTADFARVQFVPQLKFLACAAILSTLEKGFVGEESKSPRPMKDAAEVRGRCFSYDARKLLKKLEATHVAAPQILQDTAPNSTAIYCAMASLPSIDSFALFHHGNTSAYNRAIDMDIAKLVNPAWRNLRRLSLKGARVDSEFLTTLAAGPARSTLHALDVSATLATDADLVPVALFENLRELQMNQCPYMTQKTLHNVCCFGQTIEILGINGSEIPTPVILDTVAGSPHSDPLPKLKELHMETESWAKYMIELQDFLNRRKNLFQLRVWAVVPKLDFQNGPNGAIFLNTLVSKCPIQRLYLTKPHLDILKISHHLRELHLQMDCCVQSHVDLIGDNCQLLRSLTISSASLCNAEGLQFGKLRHLVEFRLIDATLGKLCSLPESLEKFSATIASITTEAAAIQLISSLCKLGGLKGLNLMTSQGSIGQVLFPVRTFYLILNSLPQLEDLVLDRCLFGSLNGTCENPVRIPIVHNRLKSIKLLCSTHDTIVPYIKSAPSLVTFEATNVEQSIASLGSLLSQSPDVRSLKLRLESPRAGGARAASLPLPKSNQRSTSLENWRSTKSESAESFLSQKRTKKRTGTLPKLDLKLDIPPRMNTTSEVGNDVNSSVATQISTMKNHFQGLRFLTDISIVGATESVTSSLPRFEHLHSIRLSKGHISNSTLTSVISNLPKLRDLDVERCRAITSLDPLKGSKLARVSIRNCPDISGSISINGVDFVNLEVITLGQLHSVASLVLHDLPQLRWVTLSNIESPKVITVCDVPRLFDMALDNVSTTRMRIYASSLHRLYIDCGKSFDSELSVGDENASIHLQVPNLEMFSWQGDDVPFDVVMHLVANTPKLQVFEMPLTSVEDVEGFKDVVKERCPLLKKLNCGDGEISL